MTNVGKQHHKPPHDWVTGNGKHSTYQNGGDWGMVYDCFTYIKLFGILDLDLHECEDWRRLEN